MYFVKYCPIIYNNVFCKKYNFTRIQLTDSSNPIVAVEHNIFVWMKVWMYYVPKYILFTNIVTIYTKPIITNEQIGCVFLYNFVQSLTSLDINNEKIREIDVGL